MIRKVAAFFLMALGAAAVVAGIWYIYPSSPTLVWGLLLLCWVCYRLRLRAIALFGSRNQETPPMMERRGGKR